MSLDAALLSLLADVAGSRDLPAYWRHSRTLVQAIVPHDTTTAWSDLSVTVLGGNDDDKRERAQEFLRSHYENLKEGHAIPDGFLAHASDAMLGGGLLSALGEPGPSSQVEAPLAFDLRDIAEPGRALLEHLGWRYVLVLPLQWGGDMPLSAGIALYRTPAEGAFEPAQLARLDECLPLLRQVYARLMEQEGRNGTQIEIQGFLSDLPVGLLLFDWKWRLLYANEEGYRQTQLWNHAPAIPPVGEARIDFRVPRALHEAGDRLRGRWIQDVLGFAVKKGELSERVTHALRKDMKATVSIAASRDGDKRLPGLLVRYSGMAARAVSGFQPSPSQLSILSQLTPGERNVALLILRGMSNQEIADALHRDITTVKDHLSHIYDKLGIRSRTQLAAQLAG